MHGITQWDGIGDYAMIKQLFQDEPSPSDGINRAMSGGHETPELDSWDCA